MESKHTFEKEIGEAPSVDNRVDGIVACYLMDKHAAQQNATLIEQNRKLISDINLAIVMLQNPFTQPNSVIYRLEQTLKDTENGK